MKQLIEALIKLLKVKSIMTITVMLVFVVLALKGRLDEAMTASVITAVITYYFNKNDNGKEKILWNLKKD